MTDDLKTEIEKIVADMSTRSPLPIGYEIDENGVWISVEAHQNDGRVFVVRRMTSHAEITHFALPLNVLLGSAVVNCMKLLGEHIAGWGEPT